jgi:hypothetical protein
VISLNLSAPFINLYTIDWQAVSSGATGIFPTEKDVLVGKDTRKELI